MLAVFASFDDEIRRRMTEAKNTALFLADHCEKNDTHEHKDFLIARWRAKASEIQARIDALPRIADASWDEIQRTWENAYSPASLVALLPKDAPRHSARLKL